jgi:hypothetical protein
MHFRTGEIPPVSGFYHCQDLPSSCALEASTGNKTWLGNILPEFTLSYSLKIGVTLANNKAEIPAWKRCDGNSPS